MKKILSFLDARIQNYGAPYFSFALFGIINYPLTYIVRSYLQHSPGSESLTMRLAASLLCLFLLLRNYWPKATKKFLPLYWYITITFCVPVLASYLLLKNEFSMGWIVNSATGLLILLLALDWVASLFSLAVGTAVGCAIFALQYGFAHFSYSAENIHLGIFMYTMIIVYCVFFLRNKEMFLIANAAILKREVTNISNELNKSVLAKSNFLNNVTHEIRGPSQIISALAEDMLDNWKGYSEQVKREFIAQISDNSAKLFDLVNNWMDIASLDTSKSFKFELSENNLLDAITSGIRDASVIARKKNIKVVNKRQDIKDKNNYVAMFHKYRIAQVITNICANAIKFSPENSKITVDIEKGVYAEQSGKTFPVFYVAISDEGPGIPEKDIEKVFDSFVQGDDVKNKVAATGVGLGLSISKKIIHGHGGKIWVENNTSFPGCTFRFFIPLNKPIADVQQDRKLKASADDKNIKIASIVKEAAKISTGKKSLNIVFLDDEDMGCMAGKLVLTRLGHNVITFTEASDFFRYLKSHHSEIDLVFVDMIMPIMGIDVIKEMKASEKYKNIPIIVQSGIINDTELDSLLALDTVGYVSKPYDASKVAKEIEKVRQNSPSLVS